MLHAEMTMTTTLMMMQTIQFAMFLQPTGLMMDEDKKGHKVDLETDGASPVHDDDDHGGYNDDDDDDDGDDGDGYYDDDGARIRQNQVEVRFEL